MNAKRFFRDKPGYPSPETIRCPECGSIEQAQIHFYEGDMWPSYVHDCERCGYTILESEWDFVDAERSKP